MSSDEYRPRSLSEARTWGYTKGQELGERMLRRLLERHQPIEHRYRRRLCFRGLISVACWLYITLSFHWHVPVPVMVVFTFLSILLQVVTLRSLIDELIGQDRCEYGIKIDRMGIMLAKKEAEMEAREVRAKAEGYAMGLIRGRQGFYIQESEPGLDETG